MNVFATREALAVAAADRIVAILRDAIRARGRASWALAGGSTPRSTYRTLAQRLEPRDVAAIEVFWSDERVVPADDPASNVGMAREAMLDPLEVADERIHAPRTELGATDAAMQYEIAVRTVLGDATPAFDLVLLGMGDDGHTASLFPGGPELDAPPACLVTSAVAPVDPRERVTFTLPLIGAARHVLFLVAGASKAPALRRVADGDVALPAARVEAARADASGAVEWFVDAAAAGRAD